MARWLAICAICRCEVRHWDGYTFKRVNGTLRPVCRKCEREEGDDEQ